MSYADAAAASGPVGAAKIPEVELLESTPTHGDAVTTVDEKEFRKAAEGVKQEVVAAVDKTVPEVEAEAKSLWESLQLAVASWGSLLSKKELEVVDALKSVDVDKTEKTVAAWAKDPVVVSLVVAAVAIVAGVVAYKQRVK